MYTVSKGPSKIVAKTRRGLAQNLERLDSRKDYNRKSSDSDNGEVITMPKPVFHSNGRKTVHQRVQHNVITPQHEEIIKFISETWIQTASGDSEPTTPTSTIVEIVASGGPSRMQAVEAMVGFQMENKKQQYDSIIVSNSGSSSPAPPSNLYYQDEAPSPVLHNFQPFDLETWWGKRLFQNITNSL